MNPSENTVPLIIVIVIRWWICLGEIIDFRGDGSSFVLVFLVNALLLLLALNLAELVLVFSLLNCGCLLVFLVFDLEAVLGGLVDLLPHSADDLGDLCDLGGGVVGLHLLVDFPSVEEKGREGPLGSRRLHRTKATLSEFSFLPIILSPIQRFLCGQKSCIMQYLFNSTQSIAQPPFPIQITSLPPRLPLPSSLTPRPRKPNQDENTIQVSANRLPHELTYPFKTSWRTMQSVFGITICYGQPQVQFTIIPASINVDFVPVGHC